MIGDWLRLHRKRLRATELGVAVHALNRMLEFGRSISARIG